jgi:acyl-CoA synthetase (AMP-forming)/AMP-acid ligase II
MRETARGWNYADVWEFIAKAIPNSSAIIQNAQRISWRQFDENSSSLAALLEKNGIRPGDKVAQYLQNCPEYLQAVFACFKAGYCQSTRTTGMPKKRSSTSGTMLTHVQSSSKDIVPR